MFVVEDDVDGGFTARSVGHDNYTKGVTRDELMQNIRDAVRCHFDVPEQLPKVLRLHYVRDEVTSL